MEITIEQLRENEEKAYQKYGMLAAKAINEYNIAKNSDLVGFITGDTYKDFLQAEYEYKQAHDLVSQYFKAIN
jgi:hypothetical protein